MCKTYPEHSSHLPSLPREEAPGGILGGVMRRWILGSCVWFCSIRKLCSCHGCCRHPTLRRDGGGINVYLQSLRSPHRTGVFEPPSRGQALSLISHTLPVSSRPRETQLSPPSSPHWGRVMAILMLLLWVFGTAGVELFCWLSHRC